MSTEEISGSSSRAALTWWKAATTVDPVRIAAASWAAEPSSTRSANAPCLSNPSGFTQSTTTLPASAPASERSRSAWPSYGTATTTTSAAAAASSLDSPRTSPRGRVRELGRGLGALARRPAADDDGHARGGPAAYQAAALRTRAAEDGDGDVEGHQIEVRWKFWNERDGVGPRWPW